MTTVTLPSDALNYVCTLVRERSAIELEASKGYLIDARLAPLAKKQGYSSTAEYLQGLLGKRRPEEEAKVVEAMTTNETSFFRDIHPFNALKNVLIDEFRSSAGPANARSTSGRRLVPRDKNCTRSR